MTLRRLSALLLTCAAGAAFAADPARVPAPPPSAIGIGGLLQVLLALGIVLGAIYGVAWLLRRMGPLQNQGAGALRIIAATSVGQRERVVVLEVEDTWIVVGVAPGRVNALHTLPRPAQAGTPGDAERPLPSQDKFEQWMKKTLHRTGQ